MEMLSLQPGPVKLGFPGQTLIFPWPCYTYVEKFEKRFQANDGPAAGDPAAPASVLERRRSKIH